MKKFWNGKIKKIEVYEKETKRRIAAFLADDKATEQGLVLFYENGKEIYWYDSSQCYHKVVSVS